MTQNEHQDQGLTPKQERFAAEYLVDLNATQAAIRAGYSPKTAGAQGEQLLRNVRISTAVSKAMAKRAQATGVTAERVIKELARVAFADPRGILEWGPDGVKLRKSADLTDDQAAAVAEVSESRTAAGGTLKAKMHDKVRALELLGKHLGLFTDKLEHSGTVHHEPETSLPPAIESLIQALSIGAESPPKAHACDQAPAEGPQALPA